MAHDMPSLGIIGFGEAGQAIANGLREAGVTRIAAWDILFPTPEGESLRQAAKAIGVRRAGSAAEGVAGADLVISAVTAAASVDAARAVATHLSALPYFLDINSVSPQRKQETAALLANRARYVDVAVMGPIHPERHRTPMLLAGPHADAIEPLLAGLGMRISVAGPQIGAAAAIKMVRSVMIKGIEALTLECFLAARRAGVEDQVMASLSASFPTLDWPRLIVYNLERMTRHGMRRAAEMDEVAATLRELGVEPLMTAAAAERQRELGKLGAQANVRTAVQAGVKDALEAVSAATRRAAGNGLR